MKTWFTITNKADAPAAEIDIFDSIGFFGVSVSDFANALKAIPTDREITLRINSPGGSVFDGHAIFNLVAERREKVTAKIIGLAASMASVVMLAARKVIASKNSTIMIHRPRGGAFGESKAMREMADLVDKLEGTLVAAYVEKTKKPEAEVKAAMAATTWYTADEAKKFGLVDEVSAPVNVTASFDLTQFGEIPASIREAMTAHAESFSEAETSTKNQPKEMQKLLKALADAGFVSSADVSEDNAVFQLQAALATKAGNLKDVTARAETAEAALKTASDKLAAQAKANAETFVAEAVKAGKLKDDPAIRALWIASFEANAVGAKAMLDAIEVKAARGAAPLATAAGKDADAEDKSKNADPLHRVAAAFSKN